MRNFLIIVTIAGTNAKIPAICEAKNYTDAIMKSIKYYDNKGWLIVNIECSDLYYNEIDQIKD